jgi:hypothetical protein
MISFKHSSSPLIICSLCHIHVKSGTEIYHIGYIAIDSVLNVVNNYKHAKIVNPCHIRQI